MYIIKYTRWILSRVQKKKKEKKTCIRDGTRRRVVRRVLGTVRTTNVSLGTRKNIVRITRADIDGFE